MTNWYYRLVPLKYQLSDLTLFSVSLKLQMRMERLADETPPVKTPIPPIHELMDGSQGFMVRGLPIIKQLPQISRIGSYLCYAPLQYQHCYIDLRQSFDNYQKKFSSKTRSTIKRKIRKYSEHCGGEIHWRTYKAPEEMREFFRLARVVSQKTYQERLLDAGLPGSEEFIRQAESLASCQNVRAYILFDGERPVSYLYCPVDDGVLIYSYLGYDPEYLQMSVGTILQWLALEQLFAEHCFRYFDFTEGQSDHKSLFATHQRQCANVYLLRRTFRNWIVIYSHMVMNYFSICLGEIMERLGIKAKVKRLVRWAR